MLSEFTPNTIKQNEGKLLSSVLILWDLFMNKHYEMINLLFKTLTFEPLGIYEASWQYYVDIIVTYVGRINGMTQDLFPFSCQQTGGVPDVQEWDACTSRGTIAIFPSDINLPTLSCWARSSIFLSSTSLKVMKYCCSVLFIFACKWRLIGYIC